MEFALNLDELLTDKYDFDTVRKGFSVASQTPFACIGVMACTSSIHISCMFESMTVVTKVDILQ